MGEESEHALTIVGRHADDTFLRNRAAVVARFATRPRHQSAAVEIDEHRQAVARCLRCRPDVQVQTVLAAARAAEVHIAEDVGLHRVVAERLRLAHALPSLNGLWSLPPQLANGSLCERYAEEFLHAVFLDALHDAILRLHLERHLFLCASTQHRDTCNSKHRHLSDSFSHSLLSL